MKNLNLPKDRYKKPVWKRCRRCGHSQKVHRAAKYCRKCRDAGHVGLLTSI